MLKQLIADAIAAALLVFIVAMIYRSGKLNIWWAIGLAVFGCNLVESLLKRYAGLGSGIN